MTPRVAPWFGRQFPEVIEAIRATPGDELVNVHRSDVWRDGWRAVLYRGNGFREAPERIAVADKRPSPLDAFREAVALRDAEWAYACQCDVCPCRELATREGRDGPAICSACEEAHP